MAIAEKALLDKEKLELIIEQQKQIMTDLQLKATAEVRTGCLVVCNGCALALE